MSYSNTDYVAVIQLDLNAYLLMDLFYIIYKLLITYLHNCNFILQLNFYPSSLFIFISFSIRNSLSHLKCLASPSKLPDALRLRGQSAETTVSAWLNSDNNLL